jgi:hypothetical protein
MIEPRAASSVTTASPGRNYDRRLQTSPPRPALMDERSQDIAAMTSANRGRQPASDHGSAKLSAYAARIAEDTIVALRLPVGPSDRGRSPLFLASTDTP